MDEQTRSNVTEAAADVADKGRDVAQDATEGAKWVAATAREQAGEVGHELSAQGQRVVADVKEKLHEQGERESEKVASSLRTFSDEARALADGRPQDAGPLADYAERAAGKVSELADRMEQRGIEGALDDVRVFARRRPGVFLLGAGIAGFAAGRLIRGATSAPDSSTAPTPRAVEPPTGARPAPVEPVAASPALSTTR